MISEQTLKSFFCEGILVGTFADLVNGLVQKACSLHTLYQTYEKGSVDGAMGRLVWVHTLYRLRLEFCDEMKNLDMVGDHRPYHRGRLGWFDV
jgi:hypothetical protein